MKTFKTIKDLRASLVGRGLTEETLGFVATMGALHEGHGALILESKKENKKTCVSIFVNPAQFNNPKDFETYPNTLEKDLSYCESLGVDYIFLPEASEIYEQGESIVLSEREITQKYEGTHRPGHFEGVLQVVMKFLNIISPDKAYFGEKDYQQYLLIKKMAEQFFMKSKIVGVPICRDRFGLALSSRNFNLSEEGLQKARMVAGVFLETASKEEFLRRLENNADLEYYGTDWGRTLMAHYVEGVRLIDNKKTGNKEVGGSI